MNERIREPMEAAIQYIMEFYGIDRPTCMELYMDEVKAYMELFNE